MRLILVPGHLCGAWLYAPQVAALGGDIAIADITRDDSTAAMAERLLAGAPERFALAGLSLGGMVALEVLARAPERLAGVCVMDTDPFAARPVEQAWRAGQQALVRDRGTEAFVRPFVAKFFAHDAEAAVRLGPQMAAAMSAVPEPVYHAQSRALDGRADMLPRLSGRAEVARVPLRVLVGAEDRICPPRLHAGLAALPGAVFAELPGCGHIASLERPEAVTAQLAALLRAPGT
ncbi:alpha/beta fold hydrolase [Paroceanicella profunda]|uniref:Alpha/beta fold hydrolase n=1 Tax=Paroceanicella profunda TaxID=2579971 RepID=A0A5B8FXX6_9RHOB|nr:alpha/beta hydrolase [Paroceanicella profunda]QDL90943.1 alpha/beta fold hydrolase [Paroceanicella profunda]